MEGRKQSYGKKSGSSSSFTTDLFGSKDSSPASSSTGIFASIFAPPPKVIGRESLRSEIVDKKLDPASLVSNTKTAPVPAPAPAENISQASVGENQRTPIRDIGSYFSEQRAHPCHLSSSIYYGGQDFYSQSQSAQSSVHTTFTQDTGEDDSGYASRGNWWQGSLYY